MTLKHIVFTFDVYGKGAFIDLFDTPGEALTWALRVADELEALGVTPLTRRHDSHAWETARGIRILTRRHDSYAWETARGVPWVCLYEIDAEDVPPGIGRGAFRSFKQLGWLNKARVR